jgi:hypothetical protein
MPYTPHLPAGHPVWAMLELELSGVGNGWTNVTVDLMDEESCSWGLPGYTPRDRVARTGELFFSLDNSARNSAGLVGAYSPDHANRRAGFKEGIRVRYSQVVQGEKIVLHVGTLDSIQPEPDPFAGSFMVRCASLDYMDDLARASSSGLSIQQNVRDDQIFSAVVAGVPRQPDAIQVLPGPDTFAVALDKIESATRRVSILQDVALSSLSYVYVQGDTLVYEPRNVRASTTTAVDTFTSRLVGLELERNRANRLNRVEVTAHPRKIDANPTTVLWQLPAGNPVLIPSNTSLVYWTPYSDPATQQPIGGLSVQTPVATTDYLFNASSDGSGADRTANLSVTIAAFGATAKLTIANNGPDGYVTFARVLGKGIYDYSPAVLQAEDVNSQIESGLNLFSFDAPYQASIATASEFAVYLVGLYGSAGSQVKAVRFRIPSSDVALAGRVLRRRVSDRVAIGETLTGLSTARHFFINAISVRADNRNNLEVEWLLAPADTTAYWLLGIVGRSELDNTTRLGFGLVLGHTDVAHGDTHDDTAHGDVVHSDTHTDDAHQDVAHGDGSTHGDAAHSDAAHSDVAHSDASHQDAHSDVAHSDTPHSDSHSDVAHQDGAHQDVAHDDVAHDDVAHADSHVDTHQDHDDADFPPSSQHQDSHNDSHQDGAHSDVAHSDVSHSDSHTDVSHSDSHNDSAHSDSHTDTHSDGAHSDVAHSDVAHVDVAHSDSTSHSDAAHTDVAHGDVAHGDVTHSDQPHGDAHTDQAHADIN